MRGLIIAGALAVLVPAVLLWIVFSSLLGAFNGAVSQ